MSERLQSHFGQWKPNFGTTHREIGDNKRQENVERGDKFGKKTIGSWGLYHSPDSNISPNMHCCLPELNAEQVC